MAAVYASRADLYRYGLPRGLLANPGRLVSLVNAATDTLTLDGHGFEDGTPLLFRAEAGGALPDPIAQGTSYPAIRLTDSTFQIGDGLGGALDLTTAGAAVVVSTALPLDEVLEFYSRFADGFLPAHLVPLKDPYPITVTALVAELSAHKLLLIAGQQSTSMKEMELAAKAQLERWAKGIPLRDDRATEPTNVAISGNALSDPKRWTSSGGGFIP